MTQLDFTHRRSGGLRRGPCLFFVLIGLWLSGPLASATPPGPFVLSAGEPICDTNPPAAPAVQLTWSVAESATEYEIYRDGESRGSGVTQTSFYNSAGLAAPGTYRFFVRAWNGTDFRDSNEIDVVIPSEICLGTAEGFRLLSAVPTCDISQPAPGIQLFWTASQDATSYDLWRDGGLYVSGITRTDFFNNTAVEANQTYTYSVRARTDTGESESSPVTVTVPPDVCSPSPDLPGPLVLSAEPAYCDSSPPWPSPSIPLRWTNSRNATLYDLLRNGEPHPSGQSLVGTRFLNGWTVTPGATYTYEVRARNALGEALSNAVTVEVPWYLCLHDASASLRHVAPLLASVTETTSIVATAINFESPDVTMMHRTRGDTEFMSTPMQVTPLANGTLQCVAELGPADRTAGKVTEYFITAVDDGGLLKSIIPNSGASYNLLSQSDTVGRVLDPRTSSGVPHAAVMVMDGNQYFLVEADDEGLFLFPGNRPGAKIVASYENELTGRCSLPFGLRDEGDCERAPDGAYSVPVGTDGPDWDLSIEGAWVDAPNGEITPGEPFNLRVTFCNRGQADMPGGTIGLAFQAFRNVTHGDGRDVYTPSTIYELPFSLEADPTCRYAVSVPLDFTVYSEDVDGIDVLLVKGRSRSARYQPLLDGSVSNNRYRVEEFTVRDAFVPSLRACLHSVVSNVLPKYSSCFDLGYVTSAGTSFREQVGDIAVDGSVTWSDDFDFLAWTDAFADCVEDAGNETGWALVREELADSFKRINRLMLLLELIGNGEVGCLGLVKNLIEEVLKIAIAAIDEDGSYVFVESPLDVLVTGGEGTYTWIDGSGQHFADLDGSLAAPVGEGKLVFVPRNAVDAGATVRLIGTDIGTATVSVVRVGEEGTSVSRFVDLATEPGSELVVSALASADVTLVRTGEPDGSPDVEILADEVFEAPAPVEAVVIRSVLGRSVEIAWDSAGGAGGSYYLRLWQAGAPLAQFYVTGQTELVLRGLPAGQYEVEVAATAERLGFSSFSEQVSFVIDCEEGDDADLDGLSDPCDECPLDPSKAAPFTCGCGVPETDSDMDGYADCIDNCADTFNPYQGDSDSDGAGDACDTCDARMTIRVGACETDVSVQLNDGTCLSDVLAACVEAAANHGEFVSCVSHSTNEFHAAGLLSGQQKGAIQRCAARSDVGKDTDGDGRLNFEDNCFMFSNPSQHDLNGDGLGDACEFSWGDVAPEAAPDGSIDVADVLLLARAAVGLESLGESGFRRANVAPATMHGTVATPTLEVPQVLSVADVLLALRAAVGAISFSEPR